MVTPEDIKAAAEVVDKVPPGAVGQDGKPVGKGHPSPMKYEGDKFAVKINGMLNEVDPAPQGAFLSEPASKVMVGECAMATAEAFGLSSDADETPIHPAWLLLIAVLAYGAIVAMHVWLYGKPKDQKATTKPERREELEGLA